MVTSFAKTWRQSKQWKLCLLSCSQIWWIQRSYMFHNESFLGVLVLSKGAKVRQGEGYVITFLTENNGNCVNLAVIWLTFSALCVFSFIQIYFMSYFFSSCFFSFRKNETFFLTLGRNLLRLIFENGRKDSEKKLDFFLACQNLDGFFAFSV